MDHCEYFYKCKFVNKYANHEETIQGKWIEKYCKNWFNSEDCERKQSIIHSECGCQPVDNMTPTGQYL